MSMNDPSNRVISLTRKREERDGSSPKNTRRARGSTARVIAVTSGKGGVDPGRLTDSGAIARPPGREAAPGRNVDGFPLCFLAVALSHRGC